MHAQTRTAWILGILALVLFIARWPLDEYMCNPETWHSQTEYWHDAILVTGEKKLLPWRQPSTASGGQNFFSSVFSGGSGTPAIFAMLGGQREVIANILWDYADIIFDKGEEGAMTRMIEPMEGTVTLSPSFTEAWSIYGWHLAWNLNSTTRDVSEKANWLYKGERVYLRAIAANPQKPRPYFDMAYMYKERRGDYVKAMNYYRKVVDNIDEHGNKLTDAKGEPLFKPLTAERRKSATDLDLILERYWDPTMFANQLAYVYKKVAAITRYEGEGDEAARKQAAHDYLQRAIDTYQLALEYDADNKGAQKNLVELREKINDEAWLKEQYDKEVARRKQFGLGTTIADPSRSTPAADAESTR